MRYDTGEEPQVGDKVLAIADGLEGLVVDINYENQKICVQFFPNSSEYWQHPVQYHLKARGRGSRGD